MAVRVWGRGDRPEIEPGVHFYGKAGDIASNRRDEQEMSVLCLHIVQAAMVYINTLMIQDVLAEPEWAAALGPVDYRGLTPLMWAHVAMHGEFKLNMNSRLTLGPAAALPGA
ncbi:Tn3 family transposase [Amycolatopsis taiwanensis]|uniref:Tn3 family transposase n=1 Tax=Amycolatopsis taiwanensis TaxID=342230 RepID=UPI0004856254|nr:Tn3 family transposase [Amycolatopsis taiwanensis]